jgi:hypothetical protein
MLGGTGELLCWSAAIELGGDAAGHRSSVGDDANNA